MTQPKHTVPVASERLIYESDWLASRPFFYNLRTGRASHAINEVIDFANLEFDPEGLNDYLDFGYCVFEHTPARDVRLLRHSARLWSGPQGLRVEYLDDPTAEWFERRSSVDEVLEIARAVVNQAAGSTHGDLVVPTSGGYDSRFINLLVEERARVRAFTYGISDRPQCSQEVVKAAELAGRLGLHWQSLPIGRFHRYLDDWDEQFGPAVHAHGMYQIEFYHALVPQIAPQSVLISGAYGDSMAGYDDHTVAEIDVLARPEQMLGVFRYGAMCADSRASRLTSSREGWQTRLEEEPRLRYDVRARLVELNRQQAALFSYLYLVPESLGLACCTPFTDPGLAQAMLALPWELRDRRRWQAALFRASGLDLEDVELGYDWRNTLNLRALRLVPLPPLDEGLLREIISPRYVRWVNRTAGRLGLPWELYVRSAWTPGLRRAAAALRALGLEDRRMPAYYAYLTLRPLEMLLRRRDRARDGAA